MGKTNPNFLNGVPELVALRLLAQRPMYGYELVRSIETSSNGIFTFGEGCVYPILHSLEARKLVKSRRVEKEGRSRNYYQLTPKGEERLAELKEEWSQVGAGLAAVFGGTQDA